MDLFPITVMEEDIVIKMSTYKKDQNEDPQFLNYIQYLSELFPLLYNDTSRACRDIES